MSNISTNLEPILKSIKQALTIAVDTETNGLNTRKNSIIGLGISTNRGDSYYVTDYDLMRQICVALRGKRLIFWNAYFDLQMILNCIGVDLWDDLYCDVVLLKHTVDEEQPFKLKEVAAKILGAESKDEKEEVDKSIKENGGSKGQVWLADPEIIAKYCIQDCVLTYKLFNHYTGLVNKERLHKFFYEDEVMPLYKTVTRFMQCRGIPVDIELLQSLLKDIDPDIETLRTQIIAELDTSGAISTFRQWYCNKNFKPSRTGPFAQACITLSKLPIKKTNTGKFTLARGVLSYFKDQSDLIRYVMGDIPISPADIIMVQNYLYSNMESPFNLSSKLHLKKVFFDHLKEEPLTRTELGAPQINDEFLKTMSEKYEWVSKLRDYNRLIKLKGTYIEGILDKQEDGIFYPQFHQHRTVSGRYSSDLQQTPRPSTTASAVVQKYNNQIRNIFIARPNHVLIGADYNSLEPRCFAHVSGDQRIKDIFLKNHDFYSTIAIFAQGLTQYSADKDAENYLGKLDKNARQAAKVYALGVPYGMEPFSLSKKLDVSQPKAEQIIRGYFDGFPDLYRWFKKCDVDFKTYGTSRSEAGRVRHLYRQAAAFREAPRCILNSLDLWQEYNDHPDYQKYKETRKFIKNGMNNCKNFMIQSLAASITNRACIAVSEKLKELGLSAKIVIQVHDEVVVECEEKDTQIVTDMLQSCMENTYKINLPLIAEPKVGKRYGDLK